MDGRGNGKEDEEGWIKMKRGGRARERNLNAEEGKCKKRRDERSRLKSERSRKKEGRRDEGELGGRPGCFMRSDRFNPIIRPSII